jgi:hypothetical protein
MYECLAALVPFIEAPCDVDAGPAPAICSADAGARD